VLVAHNQKLRLSFARHAVPVEEVVLAKSKLLVQGYAMLPGNVDDEVVMVALHYMHLSKVPSQNLKKLANLAKLVVAGLAELVLNIAVNNHPLRLL
jgi:hypothetical protein